MSIKDKCKYILPIDKWGEVISNNNTHEKYVAPPIYVVCVGSDGTSQEFDISSLSKKGQLAVKERLGIAHLEGLAKIYPALANVKYKRGESFTQDEINTLVEIYDSGCSYTSIAGYFKTTPDMIRMKMSYQNEKVEAPEMVDTHEIDFDFPSTIGNGFSLM